MNKLGIFLALAIAPIFANAESAHQHGLALLDIAWSNQQLEIELHSPADNILGFEHEPKTKEQQHLLTSNLALLKQADNLLSFSSPTQCTLKQVQIKNPFLAKEHEEHEEHTDISVSYSYHCLQIQHLKSINTEGLFNHFPNIERIKVQWVSEKSQSAKMLNKTDMLIEFNN